MGPILSASDRQARDDNIMSHMFGMAELLLRICGRPVTNDKIEALTNHYRLVDSVTSICKTGLAFSEHMDDDEPSSDEAMDDVEEDDPVDEVNALMVFDCGDDEV